MEALRNAWTFLVSAILLPVFRGIVNTFQGEKKKSHQDKLDEFYSSQASVYDATRVVLLKGREEMLERASEAALNEFSNEQERVWVDMGGGTGYNIANSVVDAPALPQKYLLEYMKKTQTARSKPVFTKIYCVDLSSSLCAVARERFAKPAAVPPGVSVEVICADGCTWKPPPKTKVHLVTMSYSLSMFESPYPPVDHIAANILTKGGLFSIVDFYTSSNASTPGDKALLTSWFLRHFWQAWFDVDGISLAPERSGSSRAFGARATGIFGWSRLSVRPSLRVHGRKVRVVATARSREKAERLVADGLAHEWRVLDLDQPRTFKTVLNGMCFEPAFRVVLSRSLNFANGPINCISLYLQGIDAVFFMNGYTATMMQQAKWFIDAAAGADVPKNQFVGHIAWHELIDSYIQVKLPNKWTLLAPGYFTENIVSYNGRKRVNDGLVTVLGNPNAPIQWIACEDIGEVAACCLLDPNSHVGKTHHLLTEVSTINDALKTISRVLQKQLSVKTLSAEETYNEALETDPRDGGRLAYFACIRDLMGVTMAGLEERVKQSQAVGGRPIKQAPVFPEVVERICGLLGGTGLVGSYCLRHLQSRLSVEPSLRVHGRKVKVIATARSREKAERLVADGLAHEWRVLDLDEPRTFKKVLNGVDAVFFMNGYTAAMMHQAKWFIDAAASAADPPRSVFVQHIGWHELIDSYIEMKLPNRWTFLQPGYFTENLVTYNGRRRVKDGVVAVMGVPNTILPFIACQDIGDVAACCLLNPDGHTGKRHRLFAETSSVEAALATISSTLSISPLKAKFMAPEELYNEALEVDPQDGGRLAYFASLRHNLQDARELAQRASRAPGAKPFKPPVYPEIIEEIVGRPALTIEEWAKRNRTYFVSELAAL
ncbi:hypothetical protein HDU93_006838 [Gonapodya sp. JEL0774]|nr:hypothetical protein HDU93_006838 [Gonapodya sp. JEL0774]